MNQEIITAIQNLTQAIERYNTPQAGNAHQENNARQANTIPQVNTAPPPAVTSGIAEPTAASITLPRGTAVKIIIE